MQRDNHTIQLIVNPTAGKGHALKVLPHVKRLMENRRLQFETAVTGYAGHAVELARDAVRKGFGMVVAAGGDGTCNEVANGLLQAEAPPEQTLFSVLPIGRGNDFAWSAGIPGDLHAAVDLLGNGTVRQMDAGRVVGGNYPEGKYFINGLGIGFEPLVNITASTFKRVSGVLSYLLAVVKIMFRYPEAVPVVMHYRETSLKTRTQQISICNGKRMGGAFLMGPDAELDDGQLDLCYVNRPVSGARILYLVTRFFRGTQKSHPCISSDLTGDITIRTEDGSGRLICHVDGEMITTGTDELKVFLHPGALSVVVP